MAGRSSVSHDTLPVFRFMVEFGHVIQGVFSECSGLSVELEVEEYKEGGQNNFVHKLPGRRKYGNITLKRGLTDSMALWLWFQSVISGNPLAKQNVSIILYDEAHRQGMRWELLDAFPVKWEGPALMVDGNTVAIESLQLAHHGMVMISV